MRTAALAGVLIASLSGCNKVLVAGDSVSVGAGPLTDQKLEERGWDATVDARVGRPTDEVLSVVRARRADTDIFVVESGYNDAGDPGIFRQRLASILDELADAQLVVVVTLNESRGYYSTANATIWDLASTHPNVRVADWAAITRTFGGLVSGDGVHLTDTGKVVMGDLIANSVGTFGA